MNLTPEEQAVGKQNAHEALGAMDQSDYRDARGVSRRDFLRGVIAASAVSGAGLGAMYFGYSEVSDPVRVGVIGTGDEGSVLIGAVNPEYVQVVAISDIRPFNVHRAFWGDWASSDAHAVRPGLMAKYGWKTMEEATSNVKVYTDYRELLKDNNVEAVITALPLSIHAQVAIDAMKAGKHVLNEKLMAHNVAQCKVMGRVASELDLLLATGHQRHYSILYDNAVNLIRWGVLGQLHFIQAQWHRGNLPGQDSWTQPLPGGEVPLGSTDKPQDPIRKRIDELAKALEREKDPKRVELLTRQLAQWKAWDSDRELKPQDFGYRGFALDDGIQVSPMAELCRWRLWGQTGGGLMAELGSHQLDAAGIFVSALRKDGKKSHPLSVHAVGGRHLFPPNRQAEDHVYCIFEFAGPEYDPDFPVGYHDKINEYPHPEKGIPGYEEDPNKKVVVTYSSINGNGFGGYGEVVMGTKGTLVLKTESDLMLYAGSSTSASVQVKSDGAGPSMDTQASGPMAAVAKAAESGPVSRGYTEQIEHWAWCIRNRDPDNVPRCHPEVALSDAVIALTSNVAIKNANSGKGGFITFDDNWYKIDRDETPDGSDVAKERTRLGC
ncbi:MAG: Gfo/Idh/MocA family oxidoreductase [Planctomycetes bacterium]|nr:Gfo/Idh/MocA family oxidoreductase [Planctomycetota bacterium]